jgi:hypothetical protein
MYRQKAAEAKQRAARANNSSVKSALQEAAATWLVLADQIEWIDRECERKTGPDEAS